MKSFTHFNPVEIHFGVGSFEKAGMLAKKYGKKALVVTGRHSMKKTGATDELLSRLNNEGIEAEVFDRVEPNPSYATVDEGAELAKKCDMVIGLGGGSAMDAAKAIAIAAFEQKPISNYFSGETPRGSMPIIEIATTAGTGSEADRYFVLTDPRTREKHGQGYSCSYPFLSIVDPLLMKTMPPRITASTGIDAFFHGLESYVSKKSTPIGELYAKEAMRIIVDNLENACRNGNDIDAREKMALASTLAGLAIDVGRTTLLHALEHPVSGHLNVPHGEGLAALSIAYMEFTYPACPEKFAYVASLLGENTKGMTAEEAAGKSIDGMKKFLERVGMNRSLGDMGADEGMIDTFVNDALKSHLLKITPRPASAADMREIYLESM